MERRVFLMGLVGGLTVTATTSVGFAGAASAMSTEGPHLAAVRSVLRQDAAEAAAPAEMQRRRWRRPPPWVRRRRRWIRRRRRCFINRRGFRVCRWY
ncbi:hypothetical protein [Phreatobacter sp.]|uniref:hypothetical protein n=1 Tax=Phreatobacter sp. TaxID=1966341 RepID=UPI0025D56ABE|nr:hypothetical protein [Phreatobacter sp.]